MEEDEIQAQVCKFPRVGNERNNEEEDGELKKRGNDGTAGSTNRFHGWHHSSRIVRVSRASWGKDRHSKVMTSKGLRDRRVRLSVTTAIQFYDLQDRLGYDQPSKAVEWLIKSAADAIAELPSLNNTFHDTPKKPSDEQGFDSADVELDGENANCHQQNNNQSQNFSLSKSACSSTSETSKGSGLSLSKSDIRVNRVKARERARERTTKEKEKEKESHNNISHHHHQHHSVNPISQTASFTELLTGRTNNEVPTTTSPRGRSIHQNHGADEPNNLFNKAARQQWCSSSAPMDNFSSGLLGPSSLRTHNHNQCSSSGFSVSQIQLGHSLPEAMPFNVSDENQNHSSNPSSQLQQFSFIPDHLMSAVVTSSNSSSSHQPSGNDYNLNFTISSGLVGYNRGTLQSNSPSLLPHLMQRFSPTDGSSTVPFFIGAAPSLEDHHHRQFSSVFDGSRLQLYYGDACRHSDQKGEAKN
ncbi:hypothetical protein VNO77_01423 [Canavalia gladiata]|uniref:Transcription factor TCP2-like n=1 Tax=Canavalia gladiata TaxID=3824 RepID=A0AAN9RA81_CANGL